ncbi:hypothetical protein CJ255_04155 [Candidatus Viridilinea mediisalina]|uniref:Uncharacterized protein n=1 Tax=Candidatus Viridilinea mediisalina TaxID=2024553 RepID=A0A2A6RMR3_9CHLR|nr:hypothetical protein CJ255_04155 [Candidatus Viridilinea mediisalina]
MIVVVWQRGTTAQGGKGVKMSSQTIPTMLRKLAAWDGKILRNVVVSYRGLSVRAVARLD